MSAQDPSEHFVYAVCKDSFFSLWSYLNPKREDQKELCDILVRFGGDLIIISVKNVKFDDSSESYGVVKDRWLRKAVDRSKAQLLGAERYLRRKGRFDVTATSKSRTLCLEDINKCRIHLVSVSLGSKGLVPVLDGESGGSFVHVLDEESFRGLMSELDTASDFIAYLRAKEDFLSGLKAPIFCQGEEDLLAEYLCNGRSFPEWSSYCGITIQAGGYEQLRENARYQAKKEKDRVSYEVDKIIERIVEHADSGTLLFDSGLTDTEKCLAKLASADRLERRMLGQCIRDVLTSCPKGSVMTRTLLVKQTKSLYVILGVPHEMSREERRYRLGAHCHIALGRTRQDLSKLEVVGIATEAPHDPQRCSFDQCYEYLEEWTPQAEAEMNEFKSRLHIGDPPTSKRSFLDEFPEV